MNPQNPLTTTESICICAFLLLALGIGAFKANALRLRGQMDSGSVFITVDDLAGNTFRRLEVGTSGFHYNRGDYPCQH